MDKNFQGEKRVIRTVEKGKTLLVDGPASVMVSSGSAEVFGALIKQGYRVLIREGKRLPFYVEDTATFDVASGESANIEEIEGNTVPASWVKSFEELAMSSAKPTTLMILGAVDSGKSSFCTYLTNRLLREKKKIAIVDGDLGQSDIGPPCTVAYTFIIKPVTDLFNIETKNALFVGVTSPSMATSRVAESLVLLKNEASNHDPDFIIINTDGWVEGEEAVSFKAKLVEKVNPDMTFCIQQKEELMSILKTLERRNKSVVDSPLAVRQRSQENRRSLRELGYIKYLKDAKVQSIPLGWLRIEDDEQFGIIRSIENIEKARKIYAFLGMKPLHLAEYQNKITIVVGKSRWIESESLSKIEEFAGKKAVVVRKGDEEGLLLALYNSKKEFLGIGILQELDFRRKIMKILTPVPQGISVASIGKIKLDKNFREIPLSMEETQATSLTK